MPPTSYYVDGAAANDTGAGTKLDPKQKIESGVALCTTYSPEIK